MIFASNNENKINQMKDLLNIDSLNGLKESGIFVDIPEDGATFEQNAIIKAEYIYNLTHESVIADDSGLCIDALNGFPNVSTHRFLGKNATYIDRNRYILNKMKNQNNRNAQVVCALAIIDKNGVITCVRGELNGTITKKCIGKNNFGFDCIVKLSNGKTLAQLTDSEKIQVNARKIAVEKLKEVLVQNNQQLGKDELK